MSRVKSITAVLQGRVKASSLSQHLQWVEHLVTRSQEQVDCSDKTWLRLVGLGCNLREARLREDKQIQQAAFSGKTSLQRWDKDSLDSNLNHQRSQEAL